MNKTAIILITKNRKSLTAQTINSLTKNTPKELYDLIVVDDGSEPESLGYLFGFKAGGIISDLILTNFGSPSICRNLGVEIAKRKGYKYLYHTDNDMYFLPGWLERCIEVKEKYKQISIIGPYCHPFMQKNSDRDYEDLETVDAVSGNSWFICTKDYCKLGLHETTGIMASEDWEFCQRVRKGRKLCVRLKPHLVLHCGITNSRGEPSIGADIMIEELSRAKVKYNLENLLYE